MDSPDGAHRAAGCLRDGASWSGHTRALEITAADKRGRSRNTRRCRNGSFSIGLRRSTGAARSTLLPATRRSKSSRQSWLIIRPAESAGQCYAGLPFRRYGRVAAGRIICDRLTSDSASSTERGASAPSARSARALFAARVIPGLVSRIAVSPKYLYSFDSASFALAPDRFDSALHKPRPPGYPLPAVVLNFIPALVSPVRPVFLAAGPLASALALFLLYRLAGDPGAERCGCFAVALLL